MALLRGKSYSVALTLCAYVSVPLAKHCPDVVVRNQNDDIIVTGDAKWKTKRGEQSDIYQLTAYQLADDVPGALIYPEQGGALETEYTVQGTHQMVVHELPTATTVSDTEELRSELVESAESLLRQLLSESIRDQYS